MFACVYNVWVVVKLSEVAYIIESIVPIEISLVGVLTNIHGKTYQQFKVRLE